MAQNLDFNKQYVELEQRPQTFKLKDLLKRDGMFAKTNTTPETFFSMFVVLVDGLQSQSLEDEVSPEQSVVVLPRIVGG